MFIYKKIFFMAIQVFLCFTFTFVVFPGVSLSTEFSFLRNSSTKAAWNPLIMIMFFNFFDTLGRYLGGNYHILNPKTVTILTFTRVIFILTFILIAFNKLGNTDWVKILNMILFAVTNGYNSTLLM